MADEKVPPKDILAVFKRLKSAGENKMCFDCRASNPTWASITYGVFLCIDCSAVHRGLGVHLTFIRSINLDTNWTRLQLRHMQCGGNGKANAFFRQHNLTTHDATAKYKSRVAAMYKEKVNNLAHKSIKEYGNSLYIDSNATPLTPEQKEVDFFEHMEQQNFNQTDTKNINNSNNIKNGIEFHDVDVGHLSTSPPKKDIRVPTIGGRKPAAKKKGLGTKKGGLGATKSKANFSAIESEVQQNDKLREQINNPDPIEEPSSPRSPTEAPLSTSLMYKTASMKREEEKLKQSDPKKAAQLERLGMGFGNRINVSHSVADSMQTVEQVKPDRPTRSSYRDDYEDRRTEPDFFDSFDNHGSSGRLSAGYTEEPPSYEDRFTVKGSWGSESSNTKQYKSEREESTNSRPRNKTSFSSDTASSEDVQKKFGSAKAISSDQMFGDQQDESRGRLDQYSSSNAISSAELFGENTQTRNSSIDVQNIKDNVNQVAGKLSNMASGVIGSLQSRYSGNN